MPRNGHCVACTSFVKTELQGHRNEDGPLLGDIHFNKSDGSTPSTLTAHRRRFVALLRAAWDSGVACVCGAAIVFSFAALFVKLMGSSIPVFQIVAVRSFVSFAVCAAYARAAGIKPLFGHHANLRFLISRGLFGAAAMTTYYFSIKMLPLADAVTLFFLNPAITAVAAWAIMREPLGLRGVGGVLISVCGLVLLTRPPFLFSHQATDLPNGGDSSLHGDGGTGVGTAGARGASGSGSGWDKDRLLGSMFGLLSALLSAGAFISIRFIGKSEPALVVSVYFHVCAAASSLTPLAVGFPAPAMWPNGVQWALLLGVSCCSFWGQILIGRSFQLLNAARASAINLTQVVYSYLLGLIFLNEQLTLLGGAGSVLIAAGALLVNLRSKAPTQAPAAVAAETAAAADGREDTAAADADAEDATGADTRRGVTSNLAGADANASVKTAAHWDASGWPADVAAVAVDPAGTALELTGSSRLGSGGEERGRNGCWDASLQGDGAGVEVADSERCPLMLSPAELPGRQGGDDREEELSGSYTFRRISPPWAPVQSSRAQTGSSSSSSTLRPHGNFEGDLLQQEQQQQQEQGGEGGCKGASERDCGA